MKVFTGFQILSILYLQRLTVQMVVGFGRINTARLPLLSLAVTIFECQ